MKEIVMKLKSRKLWLALGGVCVGAAMAFGAEGETAMGAVTTIASVVAYILTEGRIDMAAVRADERR